MIESIPAPAVAQLYLPPGALSLGPSNMLTPEKALLHAAVHLTWPAALHNDDEYLAAQIALLLIEEAEAFPGANRGLNRCVYGRPLFMFTFVRADMPVYYSSLAAVILLSKVCPIMDIILKMTSQIYLHQLEELTASTVGVLLEGSVPLADFASFFASNLSCPESFKLYDGGKKLTTGTECTVTVLSRFEDKVNSLHAGSRREISKLI